MTFSHSSSFVSFIMLLLQIELNREKQDIFVLIPWQIVVQIGQL
jgi:hypothetical protein